MAAIRLGSRASPLAMAQAQWFQALLAASTGTGVDRVPIECFTTTGDRIQDRGLSDVGGKGLFTKELDEALISGRIDAAVHSMKDLPTRLPEDLVLACVPSREDPRDAFICLTAGDLMGLPAGAVVGTASLRRQAQTLNRRPDLHIVSLRGSVQTRLARLAAGDIDATFLALAGLNRLGLAGKAAAVLPVEAMVPAAGQGALAILCRADDRATRSAVQPLSVVEHEIATSAERAFLDALEGSCRTPIAALGRVEGRRLTFIGEMLRPDGSRRWRRTAAVDLDFDPQRLAAALGRRIGAEIRTEAGADAEVGNMAAMTW